MYVNKVARREEAEGCRGGYKFCNEEIFGIHIKKREEASTEIKEDTPCREWYAKEYGVRGF